MGLLLDTIPDWGLSLRVVFAVFALCMVAAALLVHQGVTVAKPALREANHNQIVSDGAKSYIAR